MRTCYDPGKPSRKVDKHREGQEGAPKKPSCLAYCKLQDFPPKKWKQAEILADLKNHEADLNQGSRFLEGRLSPLMPEYPRAHSTEIVNFSDPINKEFRDTMLDPQTFNGSYTLGYAIFWSLFIRQRILYSSERILTEPWSMTKVTVLAVTLKAECSFR